MSERLALTLQSVPDASSARKPGRSGVARLRLLAPGRGRRVTGTPVGGGNTALPPARGTSSSSSLPTGNTALPPSRGTSSSSSLPTGNTALPPARGTAKPTGDRGLPPPRKPNQRPRSITENDVIPPFCNSKFENCSGNQGHDGHHDHLGKKATSKSARRGRSLRPGCL